jgi:DNA-binding beta-propeller fold protein YncE
VLDSRIFISYRHADSAAYAGRLYDRLKDRFGDERIFRDLEMDFGIDFVERIEDTVGSCVVMVVVIGPGWLDARDDAGNRRLDDVDDYVRVEVSAALGRSIRVIPVLVGDAKMPAKNDLPDALRPLARRNALQISDSRWDYDVGRLMQALDRVFKEHEEQVAAQEAPAPTPEETPPPAAQEAPAPTPEETPPAAPGTPPPLAAPVPERERIPPPSTERDSRRRPALAAAAAATVVAAAVIVAVVVISGGSSNGDKLKLLRPVRVGGSPEGVAVAASGSVWVANHDGAVTRIDPNRLKPVQRIDVGLGSLDSVKARGGSVWVTSDNGKVARIDASSGTVEQRIALGGMLKGLAVVGGSAWVVNCRTGTVTHVQPPGGSTPFQVGGAPRDVAVGGGRVYVAVRASYPTCNTQPTDRVPGQIAVLPAGATRFRTLRRVGDPSDVALTKDSLWVADKAHDQVLRLDPKTGQTEGEPVRVDPALTSIAADAHDVWALSRAPSGGDVGEVTRIDPATMKRVGSPIDVGGPPREIAVGAGRVWVTQDGAHTVTPIRP